LCELLWHDNREVSAAAVLAIQETLKSGSQEQRADLIRTQLFEHLRRLVDFNEHLELVCNAISYTGPLMIASNQSKQLISLYRCMNEEVRATLRQTLWTLCRSEEFAPVLAQHNVLPALLDVLEHNDDQLAELITFMCAKVADVMVSVDRSRDLANLLGNSHPKLRLESARTIRNVVISQRDARDSLLETNTFLRNLKNILQVHDSILRGLACDIISQLCLSSRERTQRFLDDGFCDALVEIMLNNRDTEAENQALEVLNALTSQGTSITRTVFSSELLSELGFLVSGSSSVLQKLALQVTGNIANQQPYRFGQDLSGVTLLTKVTNCLQNVGDLPVLTFALQICTRIASESEQERSTLLSAGVLGPLPGLINHHQSNIVVQVCTLVEKLSLHPPARNAMMEGSVKKSLSQISSLWTRSRLRTGEDKDGVKRSAEAALVTLK
jgi:hypothetical protein